MNPDQDKVSAQKPPTDLKEMDRQQAEIRVQTLQDELRRTDNPKKRAEVLVQLAEVEAFALRHFEVAKNFFEEAVTCDENLFEKFAAFLIDLAATVSKQSGSFDEAFAYFCQAAEIYSKNRTTEDKAFSLFLQALSLRPQDSRAFLGLARICGQRKYWKSLPAEYQKALEKFLQQSGRWEELIRIFQSMVETPEDSQTAAYTYFRMGDIFENNLKSMEAAVNAYKMASSLSPQDSNSFRALKNLLQKLGRHQELFELLENHLDFVEEPFQRIAVLSEMVRLKLSSFGEIEPAMAIFQQIQEIDPTHFETYKFLADFFADRHDYQGLVALHKKRLEKETDPRLRAYLHESIGVVLLDHLGEMQSARIHFEESLKNLPENSLSLRKLDFIYSKQKDWPSLIAVLRGRSVTATSQREKACSFRRLAQVYWDYFGDVEQAQQNLRNLVDLTSYKDFGLALLARFYRQVGNTEGMVAVFREKAAFAVDVETKRQALIGLAVYLEHELKKTKEAEAVFIEIQNLDPASIEARQSLKRLYREQERWTDLENLFLRELRVGKDEVEKLDAMVQLAELYEYQIEDLAKARAFYEKALTLNVRNLSALKGVERICVKQKDWPAVIEVYRRGLDLAQDIKEEAYIHLRLAQIFEQVLQEQLNTGSPSGSHKMLEECGRHYEAALLRDPSLMVALKSLIPIYEKLKDWENSVRIRKRYVESVDDTLTRAEHYFRIGEVLEKHLNREKEALSFFESAARLDPDHLGALRRLAVCYFQTEDWAKALSVHEAIESHLVPQGVDHHHELFQIYFRLGQICLKLGRSKDALAAFLEARKIRQDFVPLGKALADIFYRERNWNRAIQEYSAIVRAMAPEDQIEVWLKMATAQSEKGLLKDAEKSLLEILTIRPLHEHATESLVYLYKNSNRFDALANLYQQRLVALDAPDLNIKEGLKLIQLQVQVLADPKGALDTARKLFTIAPKDPEVFSIYRELLKQARQISELRGVLTEAVQANPDQVAESIVLDLGEIYEGKKETWDDATALYENLQQRSAGSIPALRGIGRILVKRKMWREVVENYQAEQRLTADDRASAVLSFKIGEVLANRLDRLDDAILSYKDALTKNPQLVQAMRALKKIFNEREEFDKVAPLIVSEIEHAQGRGEEAYLHYDLGRLFEEKLGVMERAIKHYESALALIPGFGPSARKLAVYYYQEGQWSKAEHFYDILAKEFSSDRDGNASPRVAAGFFYKLGRISERLLKEEKAINCFRKSLEFDSQFFPSLSALGELCEKKGWYQEAKLCLEQVLRGNRTSLEQPAQWHFRLACVEEHLGNRDMAVARYKEVLNISPTFIEALRALIRLYEEDGKWRIVLGFYDRLIQYLLDGQKPQDAFVALLQKGRILSEQVKDSEESLLIYQQAEGMATSPEDKIKAKEMLFAEAHQSKNYPLLVAQLNAAIEREPQVFATETYFLFLAEAYLFGFSDQPMAERNLQKLLQINPKNRDALALQEKLFEMSHRVGEVIQNLEYRLELLSNEEALEKSKILERLAAYYLQHEEDSKKSVAAYRRALEWDPQNMAVHRKLAEVYSNDVQYYGKAVEESHFILQKEPFHFEGYHSLGHIYELKGEQDRARSIYEVLMLLGQANEREVKFIRSLGPRRHSDLISGAIPTHILESLRHPDATGILGSLWGEIFHEMEAAFLMEQGNQSVERYDEIMWERDFDEQHPLRQTARLFGMSNFVLRSMTDRTIKCEVWPSHPPTLVVSDGLLRSPQNSLRRFWFGAAFSDMVFHHGVPLRFKKEQMCKLLLLFSKLCIEDLDLKDYDEKSLRSDLKVLKKVVSKKIRPEVREKVEPFVRNVDHLDFSLWRQGIEMTAHRFGLLISQDLKQTLENIKISGAPLDPKIFSHPKLFQDLMRNNPRVNDLVLFSIGLEFFNAREKIGLGTVGLII